MRAFDVITVTLVIAFLIVIVILERADEDDTCEVEWVPPCTEHGGCVEFYTFAPKDIPNNRYNRIEQKYVEGWIKGYKTGLSECKGKTLTISGSLTGTPIPILRIPGSQD